uniref:Uncharacterized protein n=1 Tax=Panagrolaimus sp. ES5 TaxID=591445 RepID=A0AC34FK64_9BILA
MKTGQDKEDHGQEDDEDPFNDGFVGAEPASLSSYFPNATPIRGSPTSTPRFGRLSHLPRRKQWMPDASDSFADTLKDYSDNTLRDPKNDPSYIKVKLQDPFRPTFCDETSDVNKEDSNESSEKEEDEEEKEKEEDEEEESCEIDSNEEDEKEKTRSNQSSGKERLSKFTGRGGGARGGGGRGFSAGRSTSIKSGTKSVASPKVAPAAAAKSQGSNSLSQGSKPIGNIGGTKRISDNTGTGGGSSVGGIYPIPIGGGGIYNNRHRNLTKPNENQIN